MPELDAEHRNQMAEALEGHAWERSVYADHAPPRASIGKWGWRCPCGEVVKGYSAHRAHVADALAPLVAGWIAEERERARFNDEVRREQLRMARADALREAADNIHEVSGHSAGVRRWLTATTATCRRQESSGPWPTDPRITDLENQANVLARCVLDLLAGRQWDGWTDLVGPVPQMTQLGAAVLVTRLRWWADEIERRARTEAIGLTPEQNGESA